MKRFFASTKNTDDVEQLMRSEGVSDLLLVRYQLEREKSERQHDEMQRQRDEMQRQRDEMQRQRDEMQRQLKYLHHIRDVVSTRGLIGESKTLIRHFYVSRLELVETKVRQDLEMKNISRRQFWERLPKKHPLHVGMRECKVNDPKDTAVALYKDLSSYIHTQYSG